MKLKLPNGFSLYVWDSEASMIDITEGLILITSPSGRKMEIRMPDHWMNEGQISSKQDSSTQNASTNCNQIKSILNTRPSSSCTNSSGDLRYRAWKDMEEEIKQLKDNIEAWKEGQKDELTELRKNHDSIEFENTLKKLEIDHKKKWR